MGDDNREFDTRLSGILADFAKRSTRRRVFSTMGRILLRITGVTIVPLLPINRMVSEAEAQGVDCNLPEFCGMWGRTCQCTGSGGYDNACPNGCPRGGSWADCCWNEADGINYHYRYYDCCESGSMCSGCNDTNCIWCMNKGPQFNWCGNTNLTYRCTIAVLVGTCKTP
jgi:hypothetical protein